MEEFLDFSQSLAIQIILGYHIDKMKSFEMIHYLCPISCQCILDHLKTDCKLTIGLIQIQLEIILVSFKINMVKKLF